MGGVPVNPVGTWQDADFESAADGTAYKTAIDNSLKVARRRIAAFAPYESSTPDMKVNVWEGALFVDGALVEVDFQITGTITAPTTNDRIDRIVIDELTGVISVVTGAEAASPVAPDIPQGKRPCAQVYLTPLTAEITNQEIYDERDPTVITPKPSFDPSVNIEIMEDFLSSDAGVSSSTVMNFRYPWAQNALDDVDHLDEVNGAVSILGVVGALFMVNQGGSTLYKFFNVSKNPTAMFRQAQVSTNAGSHLFGFVDAVTTGTTPTNGIFVRHAENGNYIAVCRSGGSESTLDTGVAASNGVYHQFKLIITSSNVEVFVDGVSKGSISSNIPTADLGVLFNTTISSGAATHKLDYFYMKADR